MKTTIRKTLALLSVPLVALVALFGCSTPVENQSGGSASVLHFKADGTFKVMAISDIQDGADVSPDAIKLITMALDAENPDMVVLNGDNIFDWSPSLLVSGDNVKKSIETFMAPITAKKIPFAVVFGNHDFTVPMNQEAQWDFYQTFPGALGTMNKIGDRVGNYNVVVENTSGSPALNLWFFDSGGSTLSANGSAMLDEQLTWYKNTSDALKSANGGTPIPSVAFQHIPVPQIYDLLTEVGPGTPGAVEGTGVHSGRYYVANDALVTDGVVGEGPCPLDDDKSEFDTWRQQGDVMAAVFAHDHKNDFRGTLQGIELMYDSSVGFYSYGNGDQHGVRVLEFNQDSVKNYQTRMVVWKDLTDQTIPQEEQYDGTFAHGDVYLYYVIGGVVAAAVVTIAVIVVVKVRRRIRKRRSAVATKTRS